MKKILLSLAAIMIAASSYAGESLVINLSNIPGHQAKKAVKNTDDAAFSAQSFAGTPVLNHNGQVVGFDAVLLVDKYDQNLAVVRPLAEYDVAGLKVRPVAALSVDKYGKKAYGGLGVLVPVGKFVDGLDIEVGAVAPGAEFTNGFKISDKIVPAVKARIDIPQAFKGVKNVVNKGLKVLSPVGGQI